MCVNAVACSNAVHSRSCCAACSALHWFWAWSLQLVVELQRGCASCTLAVLLQHSAPAWLLSLQRGWEFQQSALSQHARLHSMSETVCLVSTSGGYSGQAGCQREPCRNAPSLSSCVSRCFSVLHTAMQLAAAGQWCVVQHGFTAWLAACSCSGSGSVHGGLAALDCVWAAAASRALHAGLCAASAAWCSRV